MSQVKSRVMKMTPVMKTIGNLLFAGLFTGFLASLCAGLVVGLVVIPGISAHAQTSPATFSPGLGEARSGLSTAQSRVFETLVKEAEALHPSLLKDLLPTGKAAGDFDAKLLWSGEKSKSVVTSLRSLQQELANNRLTESERKLILQTFVQKNPWFPRFLEFSAVKGALVSQSNFAVGGALDQKSGARVSGVLGGTAAKVVKSISAFAVFAMLVNVASAGESAGLAGAADSGLAENIDHRAPVPLVSAPRRAARNGTSN